MMTDLDDDIARVARLRGRSPEEAAEAHRQMVNAQRRAALAPHRIAGLFLSLPDTKRDLRAYDRLPAASRAFMREETSVHVCATKWAETLTLCGDEAALIATVRAYLAENLPYHAKHGYGADHPAARSLRR